MALHNVCSWDESPNRRYRYWLEATLEYPGERAGTGICLFLMLNPNKADHDRSDETVSRCKHLAQEWGYGTLWVCNLFPVRGGDSSALPRDLMGPHQPQGGFNDCELCKNDTHKDLHINERHILEASRKANIIVCAWGGKGGLNERGREVTRLLVDSGHGDKLHTFGLTKTEWQTPARKAPTARPVAGTDRTDALGRCGRVARGRQEALTRYSPSCPSLFIPHFVHSVTKYPLRRRRIPSHKRIPPGAR